VTFRRYTGQEKDEERQEILASPPDILLTNYVRVALDTVYETVLSGGSNQVIETSVS
jgi:hypothetical protein